MHDAAAPAEAGAAPAGLLTPQHLMRRRSGGLATIALLLCAAHAAVAPTEYPAADECEAATEQDGRRGGVGSGWRQEASLRPTPCAFPVLSAAELSTVQLAQRCAGASTPLLIRGLLDRPKWRDAMASLSDRKALLAEHGDEEVRLSLGSFLAAGPEASSEQLNAAKLAYMRQAWAADGSTMREGLLRQVGSGEARPIVRLGDFVEALRGGAAPPGAYIFHNISESGGLAAAVAPL